MDRVALNRRALTLSYLTVGYNLLEGAVSLLVGAGAASSALIGFGLDSFIESLSGAVMIWRFTPHATLSAEQTAAREQRAVTLVSYTFFVLGAYVLFEACRDLIRADAPEATVWGVVIALVSLITMPLLYWLKRSAGTKLGSHSLLADAKQTLACMLLSLALLVGLGLNLWLGLWWADPAAGVFIGLFLINEGISVFRKRELCSC
ncbi:MAG TPA: cation transporter [candidate division Zixibacteria bacterium]|nr:cation transporter [candidate division Zixibacteria bacterium]